LQSIFKSTKNARCAFDWKKFNEAMVELGFDISRAGVEFRYKVPARWGGGTFVLHMDHKHKMERSRQNYVKTRLARAFGWASGTFDDVNDF
ncbi:hypothetical protein C2E23DRAFT_722723, partial [Lenzites betulinus]